MPCARTTSLVSPAHHAGEPPGGGETAPGNRCDTITAAGKHPLSGYVQEIRAGLQHGALFTSLVETITGTPVTATITARGRLRPLTPADLTALEAHRDATENAWFRTGYLTATDGLHLAEITALWLPWRIRDLAALEALAAGVPLGRALAGCGVRRETLTVDITEDGTLTARGRLILPDGTPVAVASERITAP